MLRTAVGRFGLPCWLSRGPTWRVMPIHQFDGAARRPAQAPAPRILRLPAHTALADAGSTRQGPGSRRWRLARSQDPHSKSADGRHCLSPSGPPTAPFNRWSSSVSTQRKSVARMPRASPQELPPAWPVAARGRVDAGPLQNRPHRTCRTPIAKPSEFAVDSPVTPGGVLTANHSTNRRNSDATRRPPLRCRQVMEA